MVGLQGTTLLYSYTKQQSERLHSWHFVYTTLAPYIESVAYTVVPTYDIGENFFLLENGKDISIFCFMCKGFERRKLRTCTSAILCLDFRRVL